MSRPLAIYASIPSGHPLKPDWDHHLGVGPVVIHKPYANWPLLEWRNNPVEEYTPIYYGEAPSFLWSHPKAQNPVKGESYTFIRRWTTVIGDTFNSRNIPVWDLVGLVSCAADDNYSIGLFIGGVENGDLLSPIGANEVHRNSWRNVRSFVYRINLKDTEPGTDIAFVSEVTNNPQLKGTSESNPAMFTWTMQLFDYNNL